MAITLGSSSGFVSTAPTNDPAGFITTVDNSAYSSLDVTPSNAYKITQMGWWCDAATQEANFELGLYEANGKTVPYEAGGSVNISRTNAKGTTSGWKTVTGLDWIVTPNTNYWLCIQVDDTATATYTDYGTSGTGYDFLVGKSTLADPYGGGAISQPTRCVAVYALYETIPAGMPYALSGCWSLSGSTTNSGSITVNVPSGSTLALIGVTGFKNEAYYFTGGTVSLGGSNMSVAYRADGDITKYQGGLFYLTNPTAGSQTLSFDWSGSNSPTNYPMFTGCFYAGVDTSNPFRSSGGQQVTTGTATTGSLTAQSNDMAVAFGFGYANVPTAQNMEFTSASEVWEDYSGKSCVGWAHGYPTGNYTVTRTDFGPMDDGGICGVIIRPSAISSLSGSQVQIGDSWRAISAMQVNVGDVWKSVSAAKINVGDVWKTVSI